jgi:hypothetical protein
VGLPQLVHSTEGSATSFPSSRLILNQADPNAINSQQNWQQVILSPVPSQQQPQYQNVQLHLQHGNPVQFQSHPGTRLAPPFNQHMVIQYSQAGETLILPQGTFITNSNPLATSRMGTTTQLQAQPTLTFAYPSNQVAATNMGEVSGSSKDSGIQQPKASMMSPGGTQRLNKISVPWPWSRIVNLDGHVIYLR